MFYIFRQVSSDFLSLSQLGGSPCKHQQSWLPSEIWLEKASSTVMSTKIHNSERLLCLPILSHDFFVLLMHLLAHKYHLFTAGTIHLHSATQVPRHSNPMLIQTIMYESVFLRDIPNLPLSSWNYSKLQSVSLLPGIGGCAGIWVKWCLEISVAPRDLAVECYPGNYFNWR